MSILNSLALDTKRVTKEGLKRLNLTIGGLYLLQGLAIILLAKSANGLGAVSTNFLNQDPVASDSAGHNVLAVGTHHLFDLNVGYVLAAALIVSAIAHLLFATRRRRNYEAGLGKFINTGRWTDYAFSVSFIVIALALCVGASELVALVLLAASTVMFCLSANSLEANNSKESLRWSGRIGLTAGIAILLGILLYVWSTYIYGTSLSLWVYAAAVITIVYLGILYTYAFSNVAKNANAKGFLMAERNYSLVSLIAKSAIAWSLYAAVLR